MKKHLLLLAFLSLTIAALATDPIPNKDFEIWNSTIVDNPRYYPFNSNENEIAKNRIINVEKILDAYHGQSAVKISTTSITYDSTYSILGYLLNTDPKQGDIGAWTGGMPYTEKPTGIRGYYKYNVATADSALIVLVFRKGGSMLRTYEYKIGGIKDTYTLFNFPLVPALTQTPDSVVFCVVSSDFNKNQSGVPGSVLKIDSVSFTGVVNQPATMNGDFELWDQVQTPYIVDGWSLSGDRVKGVTRSTDSKTGQYALELTSFEGEENGNPRTQPGYVTTGYWDNTCGCQKGGTPFTNIKDTLTFWYKYAPASTDLAEVSVNILKDGMNIGGQNRILIAAGNYHYVEIPLETGQTPDAVIINIISSLWQNTSLAFVGSVLKIDNMNFKSQTNTGLVNPGADLDLIIAPNPSKAKFRIHSSSPLMNGYDIYDITGAKVYSTTEFSNEIDLSNSPDGIYFIRLKVGDKTLVRRLIKQ